MTTKFFIPRPTPTGRFKQHEIDGDTMALFTNADDEELLWSSDEDLPDIGATVCITINSIGPAIIHGYMQQEGYLGVMTKPTNPPQWLIDQTLRSKTRPEDPSWLAAGIGCQFGSEISLRLNPPQPLAPAKPPVKQPSVRTINAHLASDASYCYIFQPGHETIRITRARTRSGIFQGRAIIGATGWVPIRVTATIELS